MGANSLSTAANGQAFGRLPSTTLSIGSTDKAVATTALTYVISGKRYTKAAVAAGTAFTGSTHDITADKWRSYKLSIDTSGTITITVSTSEYATEALALAAIADTPSGEMAIGIITILTASGQAWVGATDALEGGSSGNPSSDTNYYLAPFASAQEIATFSGSFDLQVRFERVRAERSGGERFVTDLQHPKALGAINIERMVMDQSIMGLMWDITANTSDYLSDLVTAGTSYAIIQTTQPTPIEILFKYTDTSSGKVQEIFARKAINEDLTLNFPKQEIILHGTRWFLLGDDTATGGIVKATLAT